jgi:uncharacterized protein (DUF362 family)
MNEIDRRGFFKKGIIVGAGLTLLSKVAKSEFLGSENIDISVVTGNNYFENTLKSIEQLGGIGKFIPPGSKVGLLVNFTGQWTRQGTYVNPEIMLALLQMLNNSGVKDITYISTPMKDYYKKNPKSAQFENIINSVKNNSGKFIEVAIPKGIAIKKAMVISDLIDCDKFINVAVNKHHSGTTFTNCLKNYMGACNRETNKGFHAGPGSKDGIEDTEFLSQCVADVNLVRKPDLCISDATEVLKSNGPFGPGEMIKPLKVYSGTDPVAMDAYGCTLLDFRPEDIHTTVMAFKHGIGKMYLKELNIKEIAI